MPIAQADVSDASVFVTQSYSMQLRQNGAYVTFLNGASGSNELFYNRGTGSAPTRVAGQVDGTALGTGVYQDTIIVKSHWNIGPYSPTVMQTSVPMPILVVNEQASPFGAGWSLAGLQRLYFTSDSLTIAVTDGTGSIVRFTRTCTTTCTATAVAADFSTITDSLDASNHVQAYRRRYRDGTVARFDTQGYLTYIADRFIDTTKFAYDASHHIQTITDGAGKALTFAYTSGKLSSITDPGGRVSQFSVNASGDLAWIKDPTSTQIFQGNYDSHHLLTQRTDRAGNTWKYTYDFASQVASDSTPPITVDMTVTGGGSLTTQRLGHRTRSLSATVLIDPASGKGTSSNLAPALRSDTLRAALFGVTGDSIRYQLDRFLAALQAENAKFKDTVFIVMDANENVTSRIERKGGQAVSSISASYSGPRLTSWSDNLLGSSVTYTYDLTFDLVTKITGSLPTVTNYLNAPTNSRIDSTRVGLNPDTTMDTVSIYTHDSRGRVTKQKDPSKDSVFWYFSTAGFQNLDSVGTAVRVTRYAYDGWGRLIQTVDPGMDTTKVDLDKLNRLDTTVSQGALRTAVFYDSLSHVRLVSDPKGQAYRFHYNQLGWVDSTLDADSLKPDSASRRDVREFTLTGLVRAHTDRNGKTTHTVYDHFGRDSILTLADGRTTTFAYDTSGLWIAASNAESTDTLRTNLAGTVTTQIAVRGGTPYVVTNTSDAFGLPRSSVFKIGTDTTTIRGVKYGYDADLRLDTLTVNGDRTFFGYNGDGLMTFRKLTWGAANTKFDSVAYSVSSTHQTFKVLHSATLLQSWNEIYTRDTVGRIIRRLANTADTAWSFGYDALGRLTNWTTKTYTSGENCVTDPNHMDGQVCTPTGDSTTLQTTNYTYDVVGNRTDNSPTLIPGNRLTSWLGFTLAYDSVGNLVHKQKAGFDQYLYWNSIGQLDSVKTNGTLVSFGYDGFGRRVRKTVGAMVWHFYYDGQQLLMRDSLTRHAAVFTYYPGADRPHSVRGGGPGNLQQYFVTEIGAGSVWGEIDSTGAVLRRYRYAPFGTLTDSLNPVSSLRFTGREYDTETQLYYYRARYYDPSLARFISEDPVGLNGGINQYAYAANDPIDHADPTGKGCIWVSGATGYTYDPGLGVYVLTIYGGQMYCSDDGGIFSSGIGSDGVFGAELASLDAYYNMLEAATYIMDRMSYFQHLSDEAAKLKKREEQQHIQDAALCNQLNSEANDRLSEAKWVTGTVGGLAGTTNLAATGGGTVASTTTVSTTYSATFAGTQSVDVTVTEVAAGPIAKASAWLAVGFGGLWAGLEIGSHFVNCDKTPEFLSQ
jgi:RHS repeat-associated protein